jgi:hypothetical protein
VRLRGLCDCARPVRHARYRRGARSRRALPPSGVRLRRIISASSCFGALKADNAPCNSGIMVPKLCIVPLDELLGIFHRGLIVGAHKSNCSADKTVFVHDISLDTSAILASLPAQKKVRPRISPRPDPIGTGYIRPCLQFLHCVTLIAAVNETKRRRVVNAASSGVDAIRPRTNARA